MTITTVIFDMDGTLVDTAPDLTAALNHVLNKNDFASINVEIAKSMIGYGAGAMIQQGLKHLGHVVPKDHISEMEKAFNIYYNDHFTDHCRSFEGIDECLRALKDQKYQLAVCTNTGEALARQILSELNIVNLFSAICGGDTFSKKKPNPEPIWGAINAVSGERSRSLMVGDSKTDIEAARAAKIPVIGVSYGYSNIPISDLNPDRTVSSSKALLHEIRSF
jgi:phosphoglycolate phosphatase